MRPIRVVLAALLVSLPAGATLRIQEDAIKAGYPAQDCSYCHTFSSDHMLEKARQMGVNNLNCGVCHGKKLPKTGEALYNGRGAWLVQRKLELKAERVEGAWLKDYVEKEKPKK